MALHIDIPYFEWMVTQIYPNGVQLYKANSTDTGVVCLD